MSFSYQASQPAISQLRSTTSLWFHPYISRAHGCRMLEGREGGSFILRESSKGGNFALSVVLPGSSGLGHYLVEKRGPNCFRLQGSENTFLCLEELLAHYCENDSIGMPCRLRVPRQQMPKSVAAQPSSATTARPALPPRNSFRKAPAMKSSPQSMPASLPNRGTHSTILTPPSMVNLPNSYNGNSSLHAHPAATPGMSPVILSPELDEEYAEMSSPGVRPVQQQQQHMQADAEEEEEYADMSSSSSLRQAQSHPSTSGSVGGMDEQFEEEYADMSGSAMVAAAAAAAANAAHPSANFMAQSNPDGQFEEEETYVEMQAGM
ncbi:tensin-2-like [Sycon ciliatum]|uniref:tensin-2-like n=1 Tax=Sycon ciliatum TaxID=27933 RepID=UPI0020AAEC68|eukprot:scpid57416/ scgid22565/ Protein sprint; SH2 poly-proline-containing Ras-interactor protein